MNRKRPRSLSKGCLSPEKRPVNSRDRESTWGSADYGMDIDDSPHSFPSDPPPTTALHRMRMGEDEHRARVVCGPRNQNERIVIMQSPPAASMCTGIGKPMSILMAAMKDKNTQMIWDALPPRSRKHGAAIQR